MWTQSLNLMTLSFSFSADLKKTTVEANKKAKPRVEKPPERVLYENLFYNPQVKFFASVFNHIFNSFIFRVRDDENQLALYFFFCSSVSVWISLCAIKEADRWLFEMPATNQINLQLDVMKQNTVHTCEIKSTQHKTRTVIPQVTQLISLRYQFERNRHWVSLVSLCFIDHILVCLQSKAWSTAYRSDVRRQSRSLISAINWKGRASLSRSDHRRSHINGNQSTFVVCF